jgi:hypothetical protein
MQIIVSFSSIAFFHVFIHMFLVCMLNSYGTVIDGFTPPEMDLKQFISQMERHQANVPKVWSPLKKDNRHWIDLSGVRKAYGKGGGCTIM